MLRNSLRLSLLTALVVLALRADVQAAQPTNTMIHVKDMHCVTCAKKIAGQLYVVPGVVQVKADVAKNVAYVVPQQQKTPSPRALWEAVEKAGFEPVKIVAPSGVFTQKPER